MAEIAADMKAQTTTRGGQYYHARVFCAVSVGGDEVHGVGDDVMAVAELMLMGRSQF